MSPFVGLGDLGEVESGGVGHTAHGFLAADQEMVAVINSPSFDNSQLADLFIEICGDKLERAGSEIYDFVLGQAAVFPPRRLHLRVPAFVDGDLFGLAALCPQDPARDHAHKECQNDSGGGGKRRHVTGPL